MKEIKALGTLTLILLLSIPKIMVFLLKVLEGTVRIIRTTLTFFIKQIESEVIYNKTLTPWRDPLERLQREGRQK